MTDPPRLRDPSVDRDLDKLLQAAFERTPSDEVSGAATRAPQSPVDGEVLRGNSTYRIVGEIARGGMGIVLRGRDEELARDVAIKVLREDFAQDPQILKRFVDEARIGGQLQHPGIVPIYELGRTADRRPYFAMKWVRGQTLAELLANRPSPSHDRHRFIAIFEQICHSIAYAHSRHVVHRDLKPSNVMIGSFGEVQVLDWGIAKLLRAGARAESSEFQETIERPGDRDSAADSRYGAVMGTPAYMPPEQARGEVDRLDERSDVFSLGGILCEILTGRPTYDGDTAAARIAAKNGAVEHAFARLDALADAPDLAALCKRCLAVEPNARPRNAQELVDAIGAHRASVEERVRAAQIEAASAQLKAQSERKARRLTLALAAAVLSLIVVAAGARIWMQTVADRSRAQTAARVNAALDRASLAFGQASSSTDPDRWRAATLEVERARSALDGGEASPELEERARELESRIHVGALAAKLRTERERSNRELTSRFTQLHAPEGQGTDVPDWAIVDAEYATAFCSEGLEIDAGVPAELARELSDRGIGLEAANALGEWAAARRRAEHTEGVERLLEVAALADPDDTRTRLRRTLADGDPVSLVRFAQANELEGLPVALLGLLGNGLDRADDATDAERVLRSAVEQHPDDFVANVYLARVVWNHDYKESARYYAAALAMRPSDAQLIHEYGWVLDHYLNESARAAALYRSILDRAPHDATLRVYLGHALRNQGQFAAAIASYSDALAIEPDRITARLRRIECYRDLRDYEHATAEIRFLLDAYPDLGEPHYDMGELELARGDALSAVDEFHHAFGIDIAPDGVRRALEIVGDDEGALRAARDVLTNRIDFLLCYFDLGLPIGELVDLDAWIAERRKALRANPDSPTQHALLGVLLREKGLYAESSFELAVADALGGELGRWIVPTEDPYVESKRLIFRERHSTSWTAEAARLERLEARFERVVRGEERAVDAREWTEFARLALRRGRWVPAAHMFASAFDGLDPSSDEALAGALVEGASAAAAVGLYSSADDLTLEPNAREAWRDRAADWMRADLGRLEGLTASANAESRSNVTRSIGRWRSAPELVALRQAAARGELGERQSANWRDLWGRLDALSASLRASAPRRSR